MPHVAVLNLAFPSPDSPPCPYLPRFIEVFSDLGIGMVPLSSDVTEWTKPAGAAAAEPVDVLSNADVLLIVGRTGEPRFEGTAETIIQQLVGSRIRMIKKMATGFCGPINVHGQCGIHHILMTLGDVIFDRFVFE